MRNHKKWMFFKYAVLIPLALVVVLFFSLLTWAHGHSTLAVLDCGKGRQVKLLSSNFAEMFEDVRYQVYQNGEAQLKNLSMLALIAHDTRKEDLEFTVIYSLDKSVIGIVEIHHPEEVLGTFDFKRNWTWPSNWDTPEKTHKQQARQMLSELQKESARALQMVDNIYSQKLLSKNRSSRSR